MTGSIQLRVGRRQLDAVDDEVPRLDQPGSSRCCLASGRTRLRVIAHERRLDQRVLDELLEQLEHDRARIPMRLQRDLVLAMRVPRSASADVSMVTSVPTASLTSSWTSRSPGRLEIDRRSVAGRDHGLADGPRGIDHEVAGEFGHRVVTSRGVPPSALLTRSLAFSTLARAACGQ